MRYAIFFTPRAHDPLSIAAASWLGRNVFSGEATDPPAVPGLGMHEIAFHTALPRRYGFHATLKAPFTLAEGVTEAMLLKQLMRFAGTLSPFDIPRLEIGRLGEFFGLAPTVPSESLSYLAAAVVQEFDSFRAPLSEAEIERRDPGGLTAAQFANLYRWGHPYVMDEFRFYMPLTGPLAGRDALRFEQSLRAFFDPVIAGPVEVANLALFVEEERGAPFRVHSLHPMGRVSARKIA